MRPFLDTNILVYSQTDDDKAAVAKAVLAAGGIISVQVLNEFAHVLKRELRQDWDVVEQIVADAGAHLGPPIALTEALHVEGLHLARHHGFAIYDAMIVAAALQAGCDTLLSEDMQHGRSIGDMVIRNPFR